MYLCEFTWNYVMFFHLLLYHYPHQINAWHVPTSIDRDLAKLYSCYKMLWNSRIEIFANFSSVKLFWGHYDAGEKHRLVPCWTMRWFIQSLNYFFLFYCSHTHSEVKYFLKYAIGICKKTEVISNRVIFFT